jgi:hypothetical protein
MRSSSLLAAAFISLASFSSGLNILLNNDDGFGSGNLRELYRLLKHEGHDGTRTQLRLGYIAIANELGFSLDCRSRNKAERPRRAI